MTEAEMTQSGGLEAVKKSKQFLAKAPSRKARRVHVFCFLYDLYALARTCFRT